MAKEKITFEQMCDPAFRRAELIKAKDGAVWVAMYDLQGLLNTSAVARQYFKHTPAWFSQRLNGNAVSGKRAAFTETEYHQLAEAFRDIAKRLEVHADEIDAAALTVPED